MSCISWNCQGLWVALTRKVLKDLCKKHKPSLVFLMETRMKPNKLERLRRSSFGDGYAEYVDPVGSAGGLALWWRKGIQLDILFTSRNCINVRVVKGVENSWGLISFVYGAPREQDREAVWELISSFNPGDDVPWLCLGDMNDILTVNEKRGRGELGPKTHFKYSRILCLTVDW